MGNLIDLSGQRFGRLVAIRRASNRGALVFWACQCDCGAKTEVRANQLRTGTSRSCGCLNREQKRQICIERGTHGHAQRGKKSSAYQRWCNMMQRCRNPNVKNFYRYGGRGIQVCERWHKFENFLADMGEPPPGGTLDRINNDGNYEPGNVRWATMQEQENNRGGNRVIECFGERLTLQEWSRRTGIKREAIAQRIDRLKWPIERALTEAAELGRNQHS